MTPAKSQALSSYSVSADPQHAGVIKVYEGIVVEVSTSLVKFLGRPWWEVRPQLVRVEPSQCS
jgi:hypothetical protein